MLAICNASEINILVVGELFSDGGEVHGLLDDLPVSGDSFVVDRCEEGPSILMGLQLSQQHTEKSRSGRIYEMIVIC